MSVIVGILAALVEGGHMLPITQVDVTADFILQAVRGVPSAVENRTSEPSESLMA